MHESKHPSMKVFISYDTQDSLLAHRLRQILNDDGFEGYTFDVKPQYNSPLYEKIIREINDSNALVAIITARPSSASVHQEIGYAIAKNIPVVMMMEKDADDGVLTFSKEKEVFMNDDFESSCERVVEYLKTSRSKAITSVDFTEFLQNRKLLQTDDPDFGTGGSAKKLEAITIDSGRRVNSAILFSAYPTTLLDSISVASPECEQWLKNFPSINVDGCNIAFIHGDRVPGLRQITYYSKTNKSFSEYLEIHDNGFVEQGFTHPLIFYNTPNPIGPRIMLHSCWTAGAFTAFLTFCKNYYEYHEYMGEITILVSIRAADELMLMGFGGKDKNGNTWAEPGDFSWTSNIPNTNEHNISISEKIAIKDMRNEGVRNFAHRFANHIANTYGLNTARCYNHDGTINTELLSSMFY